VEIEEESPEKVVFYYPRCAIHESRNRQNKLVFPCKTMKLGLLSNIAKVVERGACDKIFINTSGIGVVPEGVEISGFGRGEMKKGLVGLSLWLFLAGTSAMNAGGQEAKQELRHPPRRRPNRSRIWKILRICWA
jgi:hypothetical protein